MIVGESSGELQRTPEEQDHLDRSNKKVKEPAVQGTNSFDGHGHGVDAQMHEVPQDQSATKGQSNAGNEKLNTQIKEKSFKQVLLRSRFNENEKDKSFDCDAEHLTSDEEMEDDGESEGGMEIIGNGSNPIVKIPSGLLKKVREPWKKCLIVRLLGKNIGYNLFVTRIQRVWSLQANFEVLDIGNGFFIVKFEMMDYSKVYTSGPWVVMDYYVTVRKWQPDFKSDEAEEETTAIWVQFPNLPIEYYDENFLYHIAKALGTPLKVDINTAMAARGRAPKEKCTEYPMIVPKKMNQNKVSTHVDTNGAELSKSREPEREDGLNENNAEGFGPWTTAPSRRRVPDYPTWVLSAVYANPNSRMRDELWEGLESVAQNTHEPWLVAGDFNDYSSSEEKRSFSVTQNQSQNVSQTRRRSKKFAERINDCNLMDMGCVGPRLT
ncbi:hypothetical protein ACSBR2_041194 [Camellia fascicularis]